MYTIKFLDSTLYAMESVAKDCGYNIDNDTDYITACKILTDAQAEAQEAGKDPWAIEIDVNETGLRDLIKAVCGRIEVMPHSN